jgi:hypothetical protein
MPEAAARALDYPDQLVFDLDPGVGLAWERVTGPRATPRGDEKRSAVCGIWHSPCKRMAAAFTQLRSALYPEGVWL